ncbi:hypothetical protein AYO22_01141 [Fonsecaea multimorphosa]|nr:hypothetical protein AYO22_01141 [Fonsecaea multimorphosa]
MSTSGHSSSTGRPQASRPPPPRGNGHPAASPHNSEAPLPTPSTVHSSQPSFQFSPTSTRSSHTAPSTHGNVPAAGGEEGDEDGEFPDEETMHAMTGGFHDPQTPMPHEPALPDSPTRPEDAHPTPGGSHFPGAYGDHNTQAHAPTPGGSHFPGAYGSHNTQMQHGAAGGEEDGEEFPDDQTIHDMTSGFHNAQTPTQHHAALPDSPTRPEDAHPEADDDPTIHGMTSGFHDPQTPMPHQPALPDSPTRPEDAHPEADDDPTIHDMTSGFHDPQTQMPHQPALPDSPTRPEDAHPAAAGGNHSYQHPANFMDMYGEDEEDPGYYDEEDPENYMHEGEEEDPNSFMDMNEEDGEEPQY